MSSRQALRELQTRLAERLQAARSNTAQAASWLAVQMGEHRYLLPLEQAGEILSWTPVQRVPYTLPWFWGVANLRGNLAGVVDVGAFLGRPVARSEQSLQALSLLLLNPALQLNVALVVDQLQGLRGAEDFTAVVESGSEGGCLGGRYTDPAGQVWQELHLQALAQAPDFLNIRI